MCPNNKFKNGLVGITKLDDIYIQFDSNEVSMLLINDISQRRSLINFGNYCNRRKIKI